MTGSICPHCHHGYSVPPPPRPPPPRWRQKPKQPNVYRLIQALKRITRDRYFLPEDINKIALKLAACISGTPNRTAHAATGYDVQATGMIRGEAPFCQYREPERHKRWLKKLDSFPKNMDRVLLENELLKNLRIK